MNELTVSRRSISMGVIFESCGSLADMIIFSSVMLNKVKVHDVCSGRGGGVGKGERRGGKKKKKKVIKYTLCMCVCVCLYGSKMNIEITPFVKY